MIAVIIIVRMYKLVLFLVILEIDSYISVVLLKCVATKEAQQLNTDTLEGVSLGPAFSSVQDRGTDVVAENVRMVNP